MYDATEWARNRTNIKNIDRPNKTRSFYWMVIGDHFIQFNQPNDKWQTLKLTNQPNKMHTRAHAFINFRYATSFNINKLLLDLFITHRLLKALNASICFITAFNVHWMLWKIWKIANKIGIVIICRFSCRC